VIYLRPGTTEKQAADFCFSLEGNKEFWSFVSSWERLSPDRANGLQAVVINFKPESQRDEVEGYVERIKRDGRVDHVISVGPSKKYP
jgi:hypothetical protein